MACRLNIINSSIAMKIGILKKRNKLITLLLSLLGFTSACIIVGGVEYGTPHADFIVKGSVVSERDNRAIKNIRVAIRDTAYVHYQDSINTDLTGNYIVKVTGFPLSKSFGIELKDIDGAENGEFQTLDTIIEFKDPVFTGGNKHWYNGQTEKEFNIKLRPKK
jgi:putative lipoprotein (rSAM/lipoprotein system)